MIGVVRWFDGKNKGYGFLTPDGSTKDAFIHVSELQKAKIPDLREGDRLEFDLIIGKNGREQATNLRLI